ncbi:MAG TPA: Spy/CpxP family protein refolding chaperone [Ignavibacteria bacterium]|mgnify:CR=1 FL=1|nr:Spy/CpxP family protein refolding chaperone [Ignavibacteria bacterium]
MNYFDKNKILTIAVVALIITNLGILVYLWYERSQNFNSTGRMSSGERMQRPEGKPPQDRMTSEGGPKEFLILELKLDEKQKEDYGKLVDEHRAEMKRIREKIRNEKDDMWKEITKPKNENNTAERSAAEIGEDQKQIELITFAHFQKVRELCNDDQKKKFDEVIQETLRMMGPENPPPPLH